MKKYFAGALSLLLIALPLFSQEIPLTIKGGDVKIVKVDQITVVKVDKTVVTSFPFTVVAPPDEGFYDWILPQGVIGTDKVDQFDVTAAPRGDLTIKVKIRSAMLTDGKVKYVTRFGVYSCSVGDVGPVPPSPTPTPTPDPTPTPTPNPIPLTGKRAIIIYKDLGNSRTSMTPAQENAVYGETLRNYFNSKCTKIEGTAEVRVWPDNISLKNASEVWRQVMGRQRSDPNWIVLSNGTTGYEGPLPADEASILALAKKYLD